MQIIKHLESVHSYMSVLTFRAEYRYYVDQAGHPVMGWNFGRNGFDFRNNEEFENLPL